MTEQEARAILNLESGDCITMNGLQMVEDSLKALLNQTVSKIERAKAEKEMKAIRTLKGGDR